MGNIIDMRWVRRYGPSAVAYVWQGGQEGGNGVLDVLKEDKQHQAFANQESVRVLDYQQCIQATRTGNDQAVKARCDRIWKEIRSNNTRP